MRLLFTMLALSACGSPDVGHSAQPILGGANDLADTSVVGVIISASSGPQDDVDCSGTVISPHVVLTAAHCLDPAVVGPIDHVTVFLGTDLFDGNQLADPANSVAVASISFDPNFVPARPTAGHDIGLIVTKEALTLTPVAINRSSLGTGDEGAAVHAVGFGESDGVDPLTAGIRRSIDTAIFAVDSEHIRLNDVICEGDSGGPTIMTRNGVPVIIGVHSYTNSANCVGDGDDDRVDLHTDVIDPVVKRADPGFFPGGCSTTGGTTADAWLVLIAALAMLMSRHGQPDCAHGNVTRKHQGRALRRSDAAHGDQFHEAC